MLVNFLHAELYLFAGAGAAGFLLIVVIVVVVVTVILYRRYFLLTKIKNFYSRCNFTMLSDILLFLYINHCQIK